MEEEANFLYVAHQLKKLPRRIEGSKEVIECILIIKRAGLRRPERDAEGYAGFTFKRVPVDFDPSDKQIGYVVIIHTKFEDGHSIIRDQAVYFVEITETEEEAKIVQARVDQNKGSGFLEKGLRFDRTSIEPVLISAT